MVICLCWKPIDVSGMTAQAARRSGHERPVTTNPGRQGRKTFQPILRIEGTKPTVQRGPSEGTNRSMPCHVWGRHRGGRGTRCGGAEGGARTARQMARTTGNREGSTMTADRPGKRKSHSTSKARNQRQKAKKKAARARESTSASSVAAITPEGPGRDAGRGNSVDGGAARSPPLPGRGGPGAPGVRRTLRAARRVSPA